MTAQLEHANYTVSAPLITAAWMKEVFGWHTRWKGDAISGGFTVHVGTKDQYLALYAPKDDLENAPDGTYFLGKMNHIAVVVDDLGATEAAVRAQGFEMGGHHDYEPGRRFYFVDTDGIEFEVVQYD